MDANTNTTTTAKNDVITMRINKDKKIEFTDWCSSVGLRPADAFGFFVNAILAERKFPFPIIDYCNNE